MTPLTVRHVLRESARGAALWFLVPAVVGVALVAFGRSRGVDAHRFYGNALMSPFFLAALMGSAGNFKFRRRVGPDILDASKTSLLLGTFAWCVICLSAMVLVERLASHAGILGRAPSDWLDVITTLARGEGR